MNLTKAEARKRALELRRYAHEEQGSESERRERVAWAQMGLSATLDPWWGQMTLAGYIPIRTEIDPVPVMEQWEGTVCVPVIRGDGQPLEFHRWTPDCEMVEGPFGTSVPASAEQVEPEILIVPLLAFDDWGFRLGYGGGYYDRTLEQLRKRRPILAVGFAYANQEIKSLPKELTDQRLDVMVTERGEIWYEQPHHDEDHLAVFPLPEVESEG